jgi:hypothetical protein
MEQVKLIADKNWQRATRVLSYPTQKPKFNLNPTSNMRNTKDHVGPAIPSVAIVTGRRNVEIMST